MAAAHGTNNTSSNEHSIGSCYTVVYDFDESNRSWKVAGNGGWSELHICRDDTDQSYRILAWTHDNQEVLVNINLDHKCEYKEKSDNFHSFKDNNATRRGFGFHKSERNLESAKSFLKVVHETLTDLRRQANSDVGMQKRAQSIIATVPTLSEGVSKSMPKKAPDGHFVIQAPRDAKHKNADTEIHNPEAVKHTSHVEFDPESGNYIFHGKTPEGFKQMANQQFGVPPTNLARINVEDPTTGAHYGSKIPILLTQLKARLIQLDGFQVKGIFRLAPDANECSALKKKINEGEKWQDDNVDVNVIANLLKVWFRDLPTPLLNCVEKKYIEMSQTVEKVAQSIEQFQEPHKSLLLWLWDFCVEIAEHSETNKMGIQNLGIVIGPNLFNTQNFDNPMKAMDFSGKVVTFFQKGIEWRRQQLGDY